MKILIVCVNYNSYKELQSFIKSIDDSLYEVSDVKVDVIIADNSSKYQEYEYTPQNELLSVVHRKSDNNGYLGTAQRIVNTIDDICQYDYVAISNVDILIDKKFFTSLGKMEFQKDVGWIAPRIWSQAEERDRNPKVLERYSKRKLQIINLLYKLPVLDYIYTGTLYRRKVVYSPVPEQNIYAGHGSFMMLTKSFFNNYSTIDYPIFLFGEELYFAELVRNAGLTVIYIPDLVVYDTEHVSTGKMKRAFYYKCNKESIDYILNTFYK